MRGDLGLCYFCGEPNVAGYKTCEKHLKTQGEKLREWHRENRDNRNHIWRKIQTAEIETMRYFYNK